jgi:ABC-type glycerol-3-phosphate transport system substrate-binding protein
MMNIHAQGTAVILIPSTINGFAGWNIKEDENVVKYTKFAPPPVGPSGKAIENFWTMSFGINKDSKHKLAAWKVLTLLTSKEAAIAFAEQTQWPCVSRKSALFHDTLVNKYGLDQIELIETMYTEGNPYFFPYFPEIAEFAERITMFASKVVSGEMETDAALDSLQVWAFEKMLREGYYR